MRVHTGIRVSALIGGSAALIATSSTIAQNSSPMVLEETIVAATKRNENVRDIPAAVSAIAGQEIAALGAQSFADDIQRAPGVVSILSSPVSAASRGRSRKRTVSARDWSGHARTVSR